MLRLSLFVISLFIAASAFAQETAPGDACAAGETDYIRQSGGPENNGVVHLMRCDGSNWQRYITFEATQNITIDGKVALQGCNMSSNPGFCIRSGDIWVDRGDILIADGSGTPDIKLDFGINGGARGYYVKYDDLNKLLQLGTDSSDRLTIDDAGNIGIGTNNPTELLHIEGGEPRILVNGTTHSRLRLKTPPGTWTFGMNGGTGDLTIQETGTTPRISIDHANGNVGINKIDAQAELDVAGDIYYSGIVRDTSDRRLKKNIRPLDIALDKLKRLEGVSFVMKDDEKRRREFGLIAQDVAKVYPDLVDAAPDGTLGLSYMGLIAPLIEGVKELDAQDNAVSDEITRLEAENAALRRMVHTLSRRMDVLEGKVRPSLSPYNQ